MIANETVNPTSTNDLDALNNLSTLDTASIIGASVTESITKTQDSITSDDADVSTDLNNTDLEDTDLDSTSLDSTANKDDD